VDVNSLQDRPYRGKQLIVDGMYNNEKYIRISKIEELKGGDVIRMFPQDETFEESSMIVDTVRIQPRQVVITDSRGNKLTFTYWPGERQTSVGTIKSIMLNRSDGVLDVTQDRFVLKEDRDPEYKMIDIEDYGTVKKKIG
jgi:hypothetical protein